MAPCKVLAMATGTMTIVKRSSSLENIRWLFLLWYQGCVHRDFLGGNINNPIQVGRGPTPLSTAIGPREKNRHFLCDGNIGRTRIGMPEHFHQRIPIGYKRIEIFRRKRLLGKRLGFEGYGLGWTGLFPRHGFLWKGDLFYWVYRFTGDPVKDENMSLLGYDRHHIDFFAIAVNGQQVWWGGGIAVPNIVTNQLEMPALFSCSRIQCQQGIRIQVIPLSVSAIKVISRGSGGCIDDPPVPINGHTHPGVGPSKPLPWMGRIPGIVSFFAFRRNGMKRPYQLAGA